MSVVEMSEHRHNHDDRLYDNNQILVRGHRDSRATLMPIYSDLCQIKLKGITYENHLVTHLGFTSGRHNDVIKKASFVLVQFARYVHCKLWRSRFSCILFANFSRNIPIYNLRGLIIQI